MTTGWILANVALAIVVTAIVALPAVLIPARLDRRPRKATPMIRVPHRLAAPAAERLTDAA